MARKRISHFLERSTGGRLYRWLGALALFSAAAFIASDVALWLLTPGYNPIADTISDLAAGRLSWVMDAAIVLFAIGVLALASGFVLRDDEDAKSWLVRIGLLLLALTMLPLALLENYAKRSQEGLVLHPYLVTLFGVLVAALLWFAPSKAERRRFPLDPRLFAAVWVLAAPFLDFVPDAIQGLYERALMWMLMAAVAVAALRLLRERPGPIVG